MEYTTEQLNYFRICYIVFELVPNTLRKIFKQEWDFRYKTSTFGEWKDTPQNGGDFFNNESRRSRKENIRFLTTIQKGNSAEWESSCLLFAILSSDSIGTTLSAAIKKGVNDIRQVRNDIAHISQAEITDAEFQNYKDRLLLAFTSLGLQILEVEMAKNKASLSAAEIDTLKLQVTNLQAELEEATSDFQVAQSTIKTQQEQLQTFKTQNTILRNEEQVERATQEIGSRVASFCILPFKASHQIIRRSNDVTRILTKMQELDDGSNGAVSTIYLSGNPGCGKSEISRQIGQEFFSARSLGSEDLTFVATLNAENLQTICDSYHILAQKLGIAESTLSNLATSDINSPKETIQYLQRLILPKIKRFPKWLIIADNVVDLSLVRSYLPQTGSEEWGHGQVLITTQESSAIPTNVPQVYHESLSAGMGPEDAIELLKQVSQIPDDEQLHTVAEALEFQPLALVAAAFYIQTVVQNGCPSYSWTDYLMTFRYSELQMTDVLAKENAAYSKTMTTAIVMAINRASGSEKILRQAFSLLSLCASDPVPIEVVVNFVQSLALGQAEELIRAKILKSPFFSCCYSNDGTVGYLKVNNIVHEVLQKISTLDAHFARKAECVSEAIQVFHSFIESERNRLFENRLTFVKMRQVTTHCKALRETLSTSFVTSTTMAKNSTHSIAPHNLVSWLCSTASVCCCLGNPSDANLFSTSACNFVQFLSGTREDDIVKADAYAVQGRTLSMSCQYKLSISYHEKASKIYAAGIGEEHDKVATNYSDLGKAYREIGNHHQAKEYLEKALIIRRKIYGENHPDIATSFDNLGNVYCSLAQHKQAQEYHEKALIIRKNIYGEKHPDVARSYDNLGVVYCSLVQYKQAKEYYEKALVVRTQISDEEHADVARSYNNLGSVYWNLAHYNTAKRYHERALGIQKNIYVVENTDVATTYENLGRVYRGRSQCRQAKEYYEKAAIILKTFRGEEHPDVARSYNNLGSIYNHLGLYNQAQEYHEKALITLRKCYGEEHPDVAASYNYLGNVRIYLHQHSHAKQYYEKAMIILKNFYDEEHDALAASYNKLGLVCRRLGQFNQAKEYHEKALVIGRRIYGEEHGTVASSYSNLGFVYLDLGQYSQAREYLEKALIIRKNLLGDEHPGLLANYNHLGMFYFHLQKFNQAKEYFEKVRVMAEKNIGEHADQAVAIYNNLAGVYIELAQYKEAKALNEEALMIATKLFGEEHPDLATSYSNLARVYCDLAQYKEAKDFHEKAVMIRKKLFGEEHPDVARSYSSLAGVYCNLAQYKEAKEFHEKALKIRKKLFGEEHPDVAKSLINLGMFYSKLAQYKEAKEYHEKVLIMLRNIHGEEHANVAKCYSRLGDVYWNLGQYDKMGECDDKAMIIREKIYGEESFLSNNCILL